MLQDKEQKECKEKNLLMVYAAVLNLQMLNEMRSSKKAVEHRGIETTGIICMEEMAELQQQISKYLRGCGDILCLLEKMADVYICLKYIEKVFEIHPDQILKAIDVKLLREKGRLDD